MLNPLGLTALEHLWQVWHGPAAVQSFASQNSLANAGGIKPMLERKRKETIQIYANKLPGRPWSAICSPTFT